MPASTFDEILKFNGNHDPATGQFASGPGGVSFPKGMQISDADRKMFAGKTWDEFQHGDDLHSYFKEKRNGGDHPLGKYNDERGRLDPDRVEQAWYYTNLSESAKGAHPITMQEADDVIGENIRDSVLEGWFRAADSGYKPQIEEATITNPELRNAALNVAHENYNRYQEFNGGQQVDFDTWLTTPVTVYRGDHGQRLVSDDVFTAYSYDRKVAEKFGSNITTMEVRPIDTLGSYRLTGEYEVMVPSRKFGDIGKSAMPTGCGVLVMRDGKILSGTRIERAGNGRICGPGGHIEPGEIPKEAAKRETMEEFGIECDDLVPIGIQDGGRYGASVIFMCTKFTGTPKTDEKEMTSPKWRTVAQIKRENAFPPFLQSLQLLPQIDEIEEVQKFNINHYPAGSGKGGQFAPNNGGGGSWGSKSLVTKALNYRAAVKDLDAKIADAKEKVNALYFGPTQPTQEEWENGKQLIQAEQDLKSQKRQITEEFFNDEEVLASLAESKDRIKDALGGTDRYGREVWVDLEGVDPELAGSAATTIESVMAKYPNLKSAITGVVSEGERSATFSGSENEAMAAYMVGTGEIHLNNRFFGNKDVIESAWNNSVENNFHPSGTGYEAVLTHEIGHAFDDYVSEFIAGEYPLSVRSWDNMLDGLSRSGKSATKGELTDGLSGYATFNPAEFFAEGMAEYLSSPNPRPMAQAVGRDFENALKAIHR